MGPSDPVKGCPLHCALTGAQCVARRRRVRKFSGMEADELGHGRSYQFPECAIRCQVGAGVEAAMPAGYKVPKRRSQRAWKEWRQAQEAARVKWQREQPPNVVRSNGDDGK
jgi:hypothetical protein